MTTQRFMTIHLTHIECKGGQTATRHGCKYTLFPYEANLVYNEHNDNRHRNGYWCPSSCTKSYSANYKHANHIFSMVLFSRYVTLRVSASSTMPSAGSPNYSNEPHPASYKNMTSTQFRSELYGEMYRMEAEMGQIRTAFSGKPSHS